MRVAAHGDATALGYVERQAMEIVVWARVALDRLGLLHQDTEVVLGGGVLRAGEPVLMDRIRTLAAAQLPAARLLVPRHHPVHGALLLGLDRLGSLGPEPPRATPPSAQALPADG